MGTLERESRYGSNTKGWVPPSGNSVRISGGKTGVSIGKVGTDLGVSKRPTIGKVGTHSTLRPYLQVFHIWDVEMGGFQRESRYTFRGRSSGKAVRTIGKVGTHHRESRYGHSSETRTRLGFQGPFSYSFSVFFQELQSLQ